MRVTKNITVINKLGLHARAAAKLVKLAGGFSSAINLCITEVAGEQNAKEKNADAKSIMGVMMLAATQGSELVLTADGDDAQVAAETVCELFADCFGEGE